MEDEITHTIDGVPLGMFIATGTVWKLRCNPSQRFCGRSGEEERVRRNVARRRDLIESLNDPSTKLMRRRAGHVTLRFTFPDHHACNLAEGENPEFLERLAVSPAVDYPPADAWVMDSPGTKRSPTLLR